jgi:hypothetical protein
VRSRLPGRSDTAADVSSVPAVRVSAKATAVQPVPDKASASITHSTPAPTSDGVGPSSTSKAEAASLAHCQRKKIVWVQSKSATGLVEVKREERVQKGRSKPKHGGSAVSEAAESSKARKLPSCHYCGLPLKDHERITGLDGQSKNTSQPVCPLSTDYQTVEEAYAFFNGRYEEQRDKALVSSTPEAQERLLRQQQGMECPHCCQSFEDGDVRAAHVLFRQDEWADLGMFKPFVFCPDAPNRFGCLTRDTWADPLYRGVDSAKRVSVIYGLQSRKVEKRRQKSAANR